MQHTPCSYSVGPYVKTHYAFVINQCWPVLVVVAMLILGTQIQRFLVNGEPSLESNLGNQHAIGTRSKLDPSSSLIPISIL